MRLPFRWNLLAVAIATVSVLSCKELDVTAVDAARVVISPAAGTVRVGDVQQFQARVEDAAGNPLRNRQVSWSVTDPSLARVDDQGRVTGLLPGATRLQARTDGVVGEAQVQVMPKPVATVEVLPASTTLPHDGSVQLQVTLRAADGSTVTGPAIAFAAQNAAVATVTATGLVQAVAEGTTRILATADGRTGEATVTVLPPPIASLDLVPPGATVSVGATTTLTAVMRAADGRVISGHAVSWTTDAPSIATVTDGHVTGVAEGTARITAAAGGLTAQSVVTVTALTVADVTLRPRSATVFVGDSLALAATVTAANGTVLTNRPVVWTSTAPGFATVDVRGVVKAVAPGQTSIIGTVEGVADTATVFVVQQPVHQIAIQPAAASVAVNGTVQLTAVLTATDGTVLTRPVAWSSLNPAVATVNGSGRVTAVSVGTATIQAGAEGKVASATITVSPQPVASVTVAPPSAGLTVGDSLQLVPTLRASDGTVLTGRQVTWQSSNAAVASVDAAGKAKALAPGTATITATSEGISGTSTLTVSAKPVASVTVVPDTATLLTGATRSFTVTLRAADGSVLTGRTVAWTSSAPAVASVSPAAGATTTVTGVGPGTATVTATSEGVSGTATVTVRDPVASVSIVPDTVRLAPGARAQFQAILRSASGAVLSGRTVTWQSSDPSVFPLSGASGDTVSGTAGVPGTATITATAEGVAGRATAIVQLNVGSVTIQPAMPPDVFPSGSIRLDATVRAADGTVLTRPVTWTVDPTVLSLAVRGARTDTAIVTAIGTPCPGGSCATTVTAAAGGTSAQVSVRVLKRVAAIAISPAAPPAVDAGGTLALSATMTASDGAQITGRPLTWSSANTAIATVDATTGLVTAAASPSCAVGQQTCAVTIRATAANDPNDPNDDATSQVTVQVRKRVAGVQVAPATQTVTEGQSQAYTATVLAADGTTLTGYTVDWTLSPQGLATAAPTSGAATTVTTLTSGTLTVTATARGTGVGGNATLTILARVTSVSIAPAAADVWNGGTAQLTATPLAGATPVTGRTVTWTTTGRLGPLSFSGPGGSVATLQVNAAGCAGATCADTLRATVDGVTGVATVTGRKKAATIATSPNPVPSTPPGSTVQLAATVRAADNTDLTGALAVVWTSLTPSIATVNAAGLVTVQAASCAVGQQTCTANIEARVANDPATANDDVTAVVPITVPKPIARVVVTPAPATIKLGSTQPFSASVQAADGTPLTGHTVTWSVQPAAGVITLSQTTGSTTTATPVNIGSATLTATAGGVAGSAAVTVETNVNSVTITPASPGPLFAGGTVRLTATPRDAAGAVVTGRPFSWSVTGPLQPPAVSGADNTIADVTAAAPTCAGPTCAGVVTANVDGVTSQVTITVRKAATSVDILPVAPAPLPVNTTLILALNLRASDGTDLAGSLPVTWSSSDPTIASVSQAGVVTAAGANCAQGLDRCTATITVTVQNDPATSADDLTATRDIQVLKPVASVQVMPGVASIPTTGTQAFQADALAADGTPLTGRAIAWTIDDASVATLSPTSGATTTATAVAAGATTVRATAEGRTGTASLTVVATVATVNIQPNPVGDLFPGASAQITADAKDGSGNSIGGRAVTWGFDATQIALTAGGTTPDVATIVAQPAQCAAGQPSCATTITATVDGVLGQTTANVLKPAASVTIAPAAPPAILPGGTVQLTAALAASDGTALAGRLVTWSSSDLTIASVDPTTGLVTAVGAPCPAGQESCSVTFTALAVNDPNTAADDVSSDVVVSVLKPVAAVNVTPNSSGGPVALSVTGTVVPVSQQFTAEAVAADGTVLTGRTITWAIVTNVPANALAITPTAGPTTTATAQAQGAAQIRATAEGVNSATVDIVINP